MIARIAALLILVLAVPAAADDLAGRYRVEGTNPGGGSSYKGTAEIKAAGEVYRMIWVIEQQEFIGVGLRSGDSFAVGYAGGGGGGVAAFNVVLYTRDPSGAWCGIWTTGGSTKVGMETLIPESAAAGTPRPACATRQAALQ